MSQEATPNFARAIVVFHWIITRGLAVTVDNAGLDNRVSDDNRSGFSDYVHSLVSLVHAHHLSEDDLIFPYLRKLIPDAPYDKLSADHKLMEPLIESLENACKRFRSGDDDALAEISSSAESLDFIWHPHIAIEEKEIYVPEKLEELIEPQEHLRLMQESAKLSFANMGPLSLVVPFMLYNLESGPRAVLASRLPEDMTQQLIPVDWKDQWAPMKPFMLE